MLQILDAKEYRKITDTDKRVYFSFTNFSSLNIPLSYLVLFTRATGAEEGGALPTWAITLHTHFNHNPFRMIKMKSNVIYNLEHCS